MSAKIIWKISKGNVLYIILSLPKRSSLAATMLHSLRLHRFSSNLIVSKHQDRKRERKSPLGLRLWI